MTTQDANKLGRAAYANDKIRAPGCDSALMAAPCFKGAAGESHKEQMTLMTAWLRGWDAECVAALMKASPADFA